LQGEEFFCLPSSNQTKKVAKPAIDEYGFMTFVPKADIVAFI
jgi:hypothetical protein